MPFGKYKRRKKLNGSSDLNYKYRGGPKINCKSLKHNESQNTINIDVLRPCEKRMKINRNEPSENTIIQDVTHDQSIARILSVNNVATPGLSDLSITSVNVVNKFLTSKDIPSCIADQFLHVHQFPPVEQWGKVSRIIKKTLQFSKTYNKIIRGVFKHVKWCITNNIKITFTRNKRSLKKYML